MKKFIAMMALLPAGVASAQQKVVNVVWPFAPGSSQAVMIRSLLDSANSQQTKYQFIFQNKPGAGGSIASNAVLQANSLTVLAHSSSFYSRPLLYTESHDIDQFAMIGQMCEHGPVGLFSRKYDSLQQMANKEITVGVIPGSLTQVAATLFASQKHSNVLLVPYKDTVAITTDMLGKFVDVGTELVSVGALARMTPDTTLLAVTGTRTINGVKPIKGLEFVTNSMLLFVPTSVDVETRRELHGIFARAVNKKVVEACNDENGVVNSYTYDQQESVNNTYKQNWVTITRGMPKQ